MLPCRTLSIAPVLPCLTLVLHLKLAFPPSKTSIFVFLLMWLMHGGQFILVKFECLELRMLKHLLESGRAQAV